MCPTSADFPPAGQLHLGSNLCVQKRTRRLKKTTFVQKTNVVFVVVTRTGLEPMLPPGSGNLIRTDDIPGMNRVLYQLSYAAMCRSNSFPPEQPHYYRKFQGFCQEEF